MGKQLRVVHLVLSVVAMAAAGTSAAHAQRVREAPNVVLKSGESYEYGPFYVVINCRSMLKGTPAAEIVEGPPGVSVTMKDEMVLPRAHNCPNRVLGATMVISAGKEIEDPSDTRLIVRVTYKTRDGDKKSNNTFNLSLLP